MMEGSMQPAPAAAPAPADAPAPAVEPVPDAAAPKADGARYVPPIVDPSAFVIRNN
jgi:hypothetical protein